MKKGDLRPEELSQGRHRFEHGFGGLRKIQRDQDTGLSPQLARLARPIRMHQQHRHFEVPDDMMRHRAEPEPPNRAPAMCGHDDQIGAHAVRLFAHGGAGGPIGFTPVDGSTLHLAELCRGVGQIGLLALPKHEIPAGIRHGELPRADHRRHRLVGQQQVQLRVRGPGEAKGERKGRFGEPGAIQGDQHRAEHRGLQQAFAPKCRRAL